MELEPVFCGIPDFEEVLGTTPPPSTPPSLQPDLQEDTPTDQTPTDMRMKRKAISALKSRLQKRKNPDSSPLPPEEEEEQKRQKKLQRNRISAQKSREKKKCYVQELEEQLLLLLNENDALNRRVLELELENKRLVSLPASSPATSPPPVTLVTPPPPPPEGDALVFPPALGVEGEATAKIDLLDVEGILFEPVCPGSGENVEAKAVDADLSSALFVPQQLESAVLTPSQQLEVLLDSKPSQEPVQEHQPQKSLISQPHTQPFAPKVSEDPFAQQNFSDTGYSEDLADSFWQQFQPQQQQQHQHSQTQFSQKFLSQSSEDSSNKVQTLTFDHLQLLFQSILLLCFPLSTHFRLCYLLFHNSRPSSSSSSSATPDDPNPAALFPSPSNPNQNSFLLYCILFRHPQTLQFGDDLKVVKELPVPT